MANKIPIHRGDVGDFYEPSGSEDEYTEQEKRMLQKVRKGRQRDTNPEQELLAFNQKDDDEDDDDDGDDYNDYAENDNDFDDVDPEDGIPDARAWGKKRRDFYQTDFVDQDYSSYNAREEELAEQEESEARSIQQRLAKQLDEADFSLDVFAAEPSAKSKAKAAKKAGSDDILLKKDLSTLSHRQKEQLFKKESPEFDGLVQDFKQRLAESVNILEPTLKYLQANGHDTHPCVDFVSHLNQLTLNYCTNVSFYLMLKAKRIPIKNHPIVKRLVQIRQLLLQMDEKYTSIVKPQCEQLLANVRDGKEFLIASAVETAVAQPKAKQKKLRFVESLEQKQTAADENDESSTDENEVVDDDMEFQEKLKLVKSDSDGEGEDDEEVAEDGTDRREITYQIAKNKGLTPYRKKELRNPRVKHRNKFRKALIRRKGAVRTVRKEIKRYDGEKFGIKASVKKGIKIK